MPILKVKICGLTNLEDALAAIDMGADILGFNFYPESPRYIKPEDAFAIISKLPTYVDTAAIFVNAPHDQIKEATEDGYLTWIQLHGDETHDFCDSLRHLSVRTIKAIRVKSTEDIESAKHYCTDAVLFDAFDLKHYGGTGKTFDWNLIGYINKRVFLAGGINPANVVSAIEVGVYGIDIGSGIEASPGKKDHKKMKQLFTNIRSVIS